MYNVKVLNIEGSCTDIPSTEINKICRACLKQDATINLFEDKYKDLLFSDLFTLFSLFQADKEDGFPQKICQNCADLVTQFYSFRQIIKENHIILQIASEINNLDNSGCFENNKFILEATNEEMIEENLFFPSDHDYAKVCKVELCCPCCFITFSSEYEFMTHRTRQDKQTNNNGDKEEFTCLYCKLKFPSRRDFWEHMKQLSDDIEDTVTPLAEEYTCSNCDLKFTSVCEFIKHRTEERNVVESTAEEENVYFRRPKPKKEYHCKRCDIKFNNRSEYLEHKKQELNYTCSVCNLQFNSRTEYILHRKEEAAKKPKIEQEFTCPYCSVKFYSRGEYTKHRKEEDRKKSLCPYCKKVLHTSLFDHHLRLKHKKLPPLKCDMCKKRFVSSTLYNKHILAHRDGFFCEICGRKCLSSHALTVHKRTHEKEKPLLTCEVCGKNYKLPYLLKEHMYIHTGEKPFLCSTCGATFNSQSKLHLHTINRHTERPFKCELCGNLYSSEEKLKQHLERHEDEKNNTCNICGQQFLKKSCLGMHLRAHERSEKQDEKVRIVQQKKKVIVSCFTCNKEYDKGSLVNFEMHIRTHLGECPYLCLFCGKQFYEENEYGAHRVLHGNRKLNKLHTCNLCFRIYASNAALKNHLRTHTGEKPFQCNHCGKSFNTKTHLKTHEFGHTGEKPHKCSYCDKTFALKGNCVQHERTHQGNGDYICDICEKSFYTGSSLRKHQQIHQKSFPGYDMPILC